MPVAGPLPQHLDCRSERSAFLGQSVADFDRKAVLNRPIDQVGCLQFPEPTGQQAVRESGDGPLQIRKAHRPVVESPDDRATPALADQLDRRVKMRADFSQGLFWRLILRHAGIKNAAGQGTREVTKPVGPANERRDRYPPRQLPWRQFCVQQCWESPGHPADPEWLRRKRCQVPDPAGRGPDRRSFRGAPGL